MFIYVHGGMIFCGTKFLMCLEASGSNFIERANIQGGESAHKKYLKDPIL